MTEKRIWAHAVTGEDGDPLTIAHLMEPIPEDKRIWDFQYNRPICGQNFYGPPNHFGLPAGTYAQWTYQRATPLAIKCKKCLGIQVMALLTNSERPAEHRGQRHLSRWEDCGDCATIVYNTIGLSAGPVGNTNV